MRLTITCYLDVISSWCFWAIPAWRDLRERYGERVDFNWKIALMDAAGMPANRAQIEWFYRRSGMLMRSPVMLSSAWYQAGRGNRVVGVAVWVGVHRDLAKGLLQVVS